MADLELLQHADPAVRRIAVRALADEGEESDVGTLIACLRDADADVRAEAATALGDWDAPEVAAALCAVLPDPAVYEAAALSLTRIKEVRSGHAVVPWTRHANADVALAALRAVRELRLPEVLPAALAALDNADARLRHEGVAVLGWLRAESVLPRLQQLALTDPEGVVRAAAAEALGMSSTPGAQQTLLQALHDEAWFVREAAASTLGKRRAHSPAAEQALIPALEDPRWQVALQAARALGRLHAHDAAPALGQLLHHPMSNLRKEAAVALGEAGNRQAIPWLEAALNDEDPDVRKLARLALRTLEHAPHPD